MPQWVDSPPLGGTGPCGPVAAPARSADPWRAACWAVLRRGWGEGVRSFAPLRVQERALVVSTQQTHEPSGATRPNRLTFASVINKMAETSAAPSKAMKGMKCVCPLSVARSVGTWATADNTASATNLRARVILSQGALMENLPLFVPA